ncbi:MAG: hypothetical protein ACTJH9_08880 [Pseudoalteromonas sp.]|uniref:hypothetical protein n=1 Tax=unclassified Pseudoalteromonas TaxID=194690 RepID=UPI003F9B4790
MVTVLKLSDQQLQVASNRVEFAGIEYRSEDKVAYIEANSALSFDYKVNGMPSSVLNVAICCNDLYARLWWAC